MRISLASTAVLCAALGALANGCTGRGTGGLGDDTGGDGAASDAGAMSPDQGSPAPNTGFEGIDPDARDVTVGEAGATDLDQVRSCYDGVDNDTDDAIDCRDESCFAVDSCCQGSGRRACCTPDELVFEAAFDSCSDPGCSPGAAPFGTPAPFVVDGALNLGGDALYDSGILLDPVLDLGSEALTVEAVFVDTTVDCSTCFDGAAFGVTARGALGDEEHVRAAVAVQRRAGRPARLRVGASTLAEIPVVGDEAFRLELRPDGTGSLTHGSTVVPFEHAVQGPVQAVAWGHASNPSASGGSGVYVDDLRLWRARCAVPEGWRQRGELGERGDVDGVSSAVDATGTRWTLTTLGPALALGIETGDGRTPVAMEVGAVVWGTAPRDWALTHDGTDLWLTFVADRTGSGPALGRALWAAPVFVPEPIPFFTSEEPIEDAQWLVAAGHEVVVGTIEGLTRLWIRGPQAPAALEDGAWARVDSDLATVLGPGAEPDLIRSPDGVWLLHQVRRVGTRYHIVAAASEELVAWRGLGTVLRDGELTAFDALGATSPDVVVGDGELQLLYVGQGITARRLGEARRWTGAVR